MPFTSNWIPFEQRSKRDLWFGIAWCATIGSILLWWIVPILLPFRLSFAAVLLLAVLILFEGVAVRAVWSAARELNRRRKRPN